MDTICKIADISKYQGTVDWAAAKEELLFCILRSSIRYTADSEYSRNAKGCAREGIPFGAYHYCKAGTREEAEKEARAFAEVIGAEEAKPLFLVVDIEYTAQTEETTEAVCSAFLYTLRALGFEKIGLYINQKYEWAGDAVGLYDFVWIPHWGKNDGEIPEEQYAPKYPCALWQYTSKGRLSGVRGDVDLSTLRGKEAAYFTEQEDKPMGFDRERVIQIAKGEVGYLEKKSNAQLDEKTANAGSNNYTKYARDLDAIPGFYNGKKQGAAWCDVFVDWCFVQAYGIDAGRGLLCQPQKSLGAGCKYSRQYYQNKGRLFNAPEAGDQVFFYPSNGIGGSSIQHTGLVVAVDETYFYTVEGNTSGASDVVSNGGGVCRKQYRRDFDRVAGFGRPDWGAYEAAPSTSQPVQDAPKNGSKDEETIGRKSVLIVNPAGRNVNIRRGNGTDFTSITSLAPGTILEWVATAENGWHAVIYKKQVGWVSGSLAEVKG